MDKVTLTNLEALDRQMLEDLALRSVCACWYYDLADYLEITPDNELVRIITSEYDCFICGLKYQPGQVRNG